MPDTSKYRKHINIVMHTAIRRPMFGKCVIGYCAIIDYKGNQKLLSGGKKNAYRIEFELESLCEVLSVLNQPCNIEFVSTSKYLCQTLKYINYYAKNGFCKKDGSELKHKALIEKLYTLSKDHCIKATWQKTLVTDESGMKCVVTADVVADKYLHGGKG